MRVFRTVVLAILSCLLCESVIFAVDSGTIRVLHAPLLALTGDAVSIDARASHPRGVKEVSIKIIVGGMVDCGVVQKDKGGTGMPCRKDAFELKLTCKYNKYTPLDSEVECLYPRLDSPPIDFSQKVKEGLALISYQAQAIAVPDADGKEEEFDSDEISFAQGKAQAVPSPPLAWPVFWHRSVPFSSEMDIGIFRSDDYSDVQDFTRDLSKILGDIFKSDHSFALPFNAVRDGFNVWMIPGGASAKAGCNREFSSDVLPIMSWLDGRVILHHEDFDDCSSITWSGSGSVFGGAPDAAWIMMHEMGHFLFGQGDEYSCGGAFKTISGCENVFEDPTDCASDAVTIGIDPARCEALRCNGTQVAAHFRGDGKLIMKDRDLGAEWDDVNQMCISKRRQSLSRSPNYARLIKVK